ncbi:membrane protein [Ralstonia sp. A12]|uniref:anti-sigma factor family protein n=1 Tax=Ralstonia sp. A12 TaxID=1217052 RepID=UPI0005744476|nr:anti-sigma factor [Ralstonia sp. A12]KHK57773.1 membrane protein [Ralstonia sp. A12]
MNCDDIRALLAARADGELGAADSLRMETHLGTCSACTDVATRHDAVVRTLRQGLRAPALYMKAPASLSERVLHTVRAEAQAKAGARPQASPVRARPRAESPWQRLAGWFTTPTRGLGLGLGAGTLAAVALGVGVLVGRPDTVALTAHDITASHVRALLGARETDVLSSDRHTVKPWFNGRIDYAPPVTDLATRGFPLIGGRLDYIDGRPVAVLVYRSAQHPVDLYVRPEAGADTEPALRTERGYQLLHWRNAGMGYWAITDASADVVQAFARAVRGS